MKLIKTLKDIKQNPLLFISIAVLDMLFFFAYGFFTFPITEKIVEHGVMISNEISLQLAQKQTGIFGYLFSPEVMPILTKLLMLMAMLFIVIYIIYVIFQGTTWWITKKITQQKIPYFKYFIKFAAINAIWIGCYAVYKLLDTIISVRHAVILKLMPGTINIAGYMILGLFIITTIIAVFSYPMLKIKQIFTIPIKKTIMTTLICAVIYVLARGIIMITSKYTPITISLLIALAIMFPAIAYIKIFITNENDTQH